MIANKSIDIKSPINAIRLPTQADYAVYGSDVVRLADGTDIAVAKLQDGAVAIQIQTPEGSAGGPVVQSLLLRKETFCALLQQMNRADASLCIDSDLNIQRCVERYAFLNGEKVSK